VKDKIMIRARGPHGPGLTFVAAITRLRDGGLVSVTAVSPATPAGVPHHEFDITVYPARTAFGRKQPATVNWAGTGSRPAADAALFAGALILASQLAACASPGHAASEPAAPPR
jgi:hypothetical protein